MNFNIWTAEISVAFKIIVFFFFLYMYVTNLSFFKLFVCYSYIFFFILKADKSGE
jgi:hypothetical protein